MPQLSLAALRLRRTHIAALFLIALAVGGVFGPVLHGVLHEINATSEIVAGSHPSADEPLYADACELAHPPEAPCFFCVQHSLYSLLQDEPTSFWLDIARLDLPSFPIRAQQDRIAAHIRGPPAIV